MKEQWVHATQTTTGGWTPIHTTEKLWLQPIAGISVPTDPLTLLPKVPTFKSVDEAQKWLDNYPDG